MAHPGSICPLHSAIGLLTTGCGLSVVDLHEQLDLHRISVHDKLTTKESFEREFLACTRRAHDEATTDLGASSADEDRLSGLAFRSIRMLFIAATMETAGGVIAKKLAEHEGVCYFQVMQGTGGTREGLPSGSRHPGQAEPIDALSGDM